MARLLAILACFISYASALGLSGRRWAEDVAGAEVGKEETDAWRYDAGTAVHAADATQADGSQAEVVDLVTVMPEDVFKYKFPARGDEFTPRMLAMRGCSGSSAIMLHARKLLRFHGIPVTWGGQPNIVGGKPQPPTGMAWPDEMLSPRINWLLEKAGGDMGLAVDMANTAATSKNMTFFLKGMVQHLQGDRLGNDEWDSVKGPLVKLKTMVVVGTRKNTLDQVLCQIKDCFQHSYGIPVDVRTGKESDLCFDRRKIRLLSEDVVVTNNASTDLDRSVAVSNMIDNKGLHFRRNIGYKALVNSSQLLRALDIEEKLVARAKNNLKSAGLNFSTVYAEDLLDFQTSLKGAQERAVVAWCTLLRSFGVQPDARAIQFYLKHFANTYPVQAKHKDVIHNFEEVHQTLLQTKYRTLIRFD